MSDATLVLALLGANALWATYVWLLGAIAASWLSHRKGYGEKPGLATGLLLPVLGPLAWLVWPARTTSRWKTQGPLPSRRARREGRTRPDAPPDRTDAPE
jgi:hypothetical protein